jgi:DNA replication factor GINS
LYNELLDKWKNELKNKELGMLPGDFVQRITNYLKEIANEQKMLDKKTVKASLLKIEEHNVKRMLDDIARIRYRKLIKTAAGSVEKAQGLLSFEEKVYLNLRATSETYQTFIKEILYGRGEKAEGKSKFAILRILKDVPQIVGSDMKVYGPFKAEDIAVLPLGNAKILVKQGIASEIEIS